MTESGGASIEVVIAAPAAEVWAALRDPQLIRRWHGWEDNGLDAEIEQIYGAAATAEESGTRLVLAGGDTVDLATVPGGTRLRLRRAPLGSNPEWDAYYDDITEGWTSFLQQLRFALERHPDSDRRTLQLAATPGTAGGIAERLGLADLRDRDAGTRYAATMAPAEQATGQVWFVSERQLGITVDGYGDGLLILAEEPVAPHRPDGGSMVLLTAYTGPDDFAAISERWNGWWSDEFGTAKGDNG